ncbi:hypothetical protein [Solidesulfovibrio sp.]
MEAGGSFVEKKYSGTDRGKIFIDSLRIRVSRFRTAGLGDEDFEGQLYGSREDNFFSRLWELNLAERLQESGLDISSRRTGPDFKALIDGTVVWFEAISPKPEGLPKEYFCPVAEGTSIRCITVPFEKILLRVTSAIRDKAKKFDHYISDGIVNENDICVVAIDTTQLGMDGAVGVSQNPTIVEATYPIGPLELKIDRETGDIVDSGLSYRPTVPKISPNGFVSVETDSFLSGGYRHVGAAIGSFWTMPRTHFTLVHNISAGNRLAIGVLKVEEEYVPANNQKEFVLRKLTSDQIGR